MPARPDPQKEFSELLEQNPSMSTALAAIKTLLTTLELSNGKILLDENYKWVFHCSNYR